MNRATDKQMHSRHLLTRVLALLVTTMLSFLGLAGFASPASAATFASMAMLQAKPEPSATGNQMAFQFSGHSTMPVACIAITFSSSSDPSGAHTTPLGFNASGAQFSGTFFPSLSGWSTNNTPGVAKFVRSSPTAPSLTSSTDIQIANITNGSTPNQTYWAHVETFSNATCTNRVDVGTTTVIWTNDTTVSVTVDQAMTFSLTGLNSGTCNGAPITGTGSSASAISLGRVEPETRATGGQTLNVSTNASQGFSISARLDRPLNDGLGHNIVGISAPPTAPIAFPPPGTEAFGFTTNSSALSGVADRFTAGGPKWAALPLNSVEVMRANGVGSHANCLAYAITIGPQTVGGHYESAVTYTLVPRF